MLRRRSFVLFAVAVGSLLLVYTFFPRTSRPELDETADRQNSESHTAVSQINDTDGWTRFRGPNGRGVSSDKNIPTTWSETENLAWKTELPGYGASSPVLTDEFVFLTSYSGFGTNLKSPGDINQLKRQVICIAREDGRLVWTREFKTTTTEDPYRGMGVPQHGYATNTSVTDGNRLFVFLGKEGVFAFDLKGNQLWQISVGTGSSNRQWGSAASLILVDGLLIVNASEESQSLYGIDVETGKIQWESEASTLELCFSTPAVANIGGQRKNLVLAVPGEVWGLNPKTGKLAWYVPTKLTGNLSPSIIIEDDNAYAFGGYRSSGSLAIDISKPEVNEGSVAWTSRTTSYVPTPVMVDGRFYWIDDKGIYHCSDAETGKEIAKKRVPGITGGGRHVYASALAINGIIYAQTRSSGLFVIEPSDDIKIVAQNKFSEDDSVFNATPAVDNGQLFLRSDKYLYCVAKTK